MESNPAVGLLGFWMMMQLVATLALVIGGIYLMYCVGRAATGLDRMASAMEDWVALQSAAHQNSTPSVPSTPASSTASFSPLPVPPTAHSEPQPEYSAPAQPIQTESKFDEPNR